MAVFSGSLGFRRYLVTGQLPKDFRSDMETRIRQNAFEPFRENDPREEASGWVCADNLFDTDLFPDRWLDENCVRLTLRTDKRRVPAKLLKNECEKIQANWLVKFQRERLTRQEKDQIKEMVMGQFLERALPDTRGTDLYWDLDRGEVFFFAGGEKANDAFKTIFEKTFEVKISPLFPFAMALRVLDDRGRAGAEAAAESAFAGGRV